MLDLRKLQVWRKPEVEAMVFANQPEGQCEGDIAGALELGHNGDRIWIRFTIQQTGHSVPYVVLVAEGGARCSDRMVKRFMSFSGLRVLREREGPHPSVRVYLVKNRAKAIP